MTSHEFNLESLNSSSLKYAPSMQLNALCPGEWGNTHRNCLRLETSLFKSPAKLDRRYCT
jgi:hypothetical protein